MDARIQFGFYREFIMTEDINYEMAKEISSILGKFYKKDPYTCRGSVYGFIKFLLKKTPDKKLIREELNVLLKETDGSFN